jgi:hypothetical protein
MATPALVPRLSDAAVSVQWLAALVLPAATYLILVALVAPRSVPVFEISLLTIGGLIAMTAFGIFRLRLSPLSPA